MSKIAVTTADINQVDRAKVVNDNFIDHLNHLESRVNIEREASKLNLMCFENCSMTGQDFMELFDSQMQSRQLDLMARALRVENKVFYTIGSSGHEGNVLLGRLSRHTDPAFLHYRSGGFMAERSRKISEIDFIGDTALSLAASSEDPASGGRHKVWGSKPLWVLPQTSTIASHLPKAVGTAIAISHSALLDHSIPIPEDSISLCSFGDASCNHSTAVGAVNAAQWAHYQGIPVPILFICEDNGLGISVVTPKNWIHENFSRRQGLKYFQANGLDLCESFDVVDKAIRYCRSNRQPVFLHLNVVRLMGHAGTDIEIVYRDLLDIQQDEKKDPLLRSATIAVESGLMKPEEILSRYDHLREYCVAVANRADLRPRLETAAQVMAPLAPYSPGRVKIEVTREDYTDERARLYPDKNALPETLAPQHLAIQINRVLAEMLVKYPQALIFGEDVAKKGGVYTVTKGLSAIFKSSRVFNTLLDEQTILGLAQGYGNLGMLPIPEIQYLAYFHNASDQIRGEAASLQFFSNDQYRNPMVVRIAAFGYQKGFGGHFHNDNSIAALRDIPSIIIACPSRGDDAVKMMRTLMALAIIDGRVSLFLEPIALYMLKDLYAGGDNKWLFRYPDLDDVIPFGEGRIYNEHANDLLIITFANGVPMSLRAQKTIEANMNKKVRILDLRWLQPLNQAQIIEHATACKAVLIIDEGRQTGSVGEGVVSILVQSLPHRVPIVRVAAQDSYIPLGAAATKVLPSEETIVEAMEDILSRN